MTVDTKFEISGTLKQNPLAELIVEICEVQLSGSLRLANGDRKSVIYLKQGRVVHAVSNHRDHRLFSIGLARRVFTKEVFGKFPNFTNDIEFAAALRNSGAYTEETLKELSVAQIEEIFIASLSLTAGDWVFSPHARLRNDLASEVDTSSYLIDFARCLGTDWVSERFKDVGEEFIRWNGTPPKIDLQPHEQAVLGLFGKQGLTLEDLRGQSDLPNSGLLQALYALWLGGFLTRREWTRAFSSLKLDVIRTAHFEKTGDAVALPKYPEPNAKAPVAAAAPDTSAQPLKPLEIEISIDEYLLQVENAANFYEILDIDAQANIDTIKTKYFAYARSFHPDRYHREDPEKHARIQRSFTMLAHAYETLKSPESREAYDFKIRKELELKTRRAADGSDKVAEGGAQAEQGLTNFESGLEKFQEEDFAAAATFLARAVHFSPQNALYRAYFGKALSYTGSKYRHKAEAELQEAAKLEPKNAKIRMMLIEFFLDMEMNRRAEGELRRFLEIAPGNKEALDMMNRMQEMLA